jgi:hypothetical protein
MPGMAARRLTDYGSHVPGQPTASPGPIATLARCLTVTREAEQMYLGGSTVGIVAVVPILLFLVSYLIYTQAPKHRYGNSDIRAASDARAKAVSEF